MSLEISTTLSLPQILEEIDRTTHEISTLDHELNELFSERGHLEKRVLSLSSLDKQLESVEHASKEMASKMQAASLSGNEISKQVSELDTSQRRVQQVLSRVTRMLDLKDTIKSVEECLNTANYDAYLSAAQQTHRILLSATTQPQQPPQEEEEEDLRSIDEVSYEILQDLQLRLCSLVRQQCENAQREQSSTHILQYASLYPLLGASMAAEGLALYCRCIADMLRTQVRDQHLTLDTQATDAVIAYTSMIERYIDAVFTTITQHETTLTRTFGASQVYPVHTLVQVLHEQSEHEMCKLLQHYVSTHELDGLTRRIGDFNNQTRHILRQRHQTSMHSSASSRHAQLDETLSVMRQIAAVQTLDKILDEIAHISQELMAYETTMRSLLQEHVTTESASELDEKKKSTTTTTTLYTLPTHSEIASIRTRLTGDYIVLEQFNMQYQMYRVLVEENNIVNATAVTTTTTPTAAAAAVSGGGGGGADADDDASGGGGGTQAYRSTLSGAIYYLLKELALRSFNTYDCNVSCAIINHVCNSLESIYKEWLDATLKQQPAQADKTNIAQQFYQSTTRSFYDITKMATKSGSNLSGRGGGGSGGSHHEDDQLHRVSVLILNTIDDSIGDNALMTTQLEQACNSVFQDVSEKEKFKLRQTIQGLEDIAKAYQRIVERGLYRYALTFTPMLQSSLTRFKDEKYDISDKQFNASTGSSSSSNNNNGGGGGASDTGGDGDTGHRGGGDHRSFVEILVQDSKTTFARLSQQFTPNNFDRILVYILSHYLNELERFILYHKFTFWGALKFDKHRQELQSYFSELSNAQSTRDQFIRIRSVAEILQFSKIDEAKHYDDMMNASNVAVTTTTADQTLTTDEIKKFLSLRVEFNQFDIQQLKL